MWHILRRRLATGTATTDHPQPPPAQFRGMPRLRESDCQGEAACASVCPTTALDVEHPSVGDGWTWTLDRAACTGCGLCFEACPHNALERDPESEFAARTRADLVFRVHFVSPGEMNVGTK